ncbi:hypothetical protein AAMO2058_001397400, partial [Amorphochlora amoebiformis]
TEAERIRHELRNASRLTYHDASWKQRLEKPFHDGTLNPDDSTPDSWDNARVFRPNRTLRRAFTTDREDSGKFLEKVPKDLQRIRKNEWKEGKKEGKGGGGERRRYGQRSRVRDLSRSRHPPSSRHRSVSRRRHHPSSTHRPTAPRYDHSRPRRKTARPRSPDLEPSEHVQPTSKENVAQANHRLELLGGMDRRTKLV